MIETNRTQRVQGVFPSALDFSGFLDEIPFGIHVIDRNRRVMTANRSLEALTGLPRETARGIPCMHLMRGNFCLERCPVLNPGGDSAESLCLEGNIINRERQKIPVRVTFAPVRDTSGKLVGYIETVEDIRAIQAGSGRLDPTFGFGRIVGQSAQMERLFRILPAIAQSDSSVLVTGETGSGKDFLAEAIHQASERAKHAFIKVNCGALPETLLESELFGHQKGAFTGAVDNKPGRFRLAHNGTLYLTEIGDLPLPLQVKLLTFLDDKVVYPLGSTRGFQADVRVIAATHRNLERMVREGRFREDLLFRLNVVRVHLPPLRERGEDVRLLLDHFLHIHASHLNRAVTGFTADALEILLRYAYPGNVRELKNIVEYAVNIGESERIQPADLPAYLSESSVQRRLEESSHDAAGAARADSEPRDAPASASASWSEMERKMIVEALIRAKGRRGQAASLLGWGRSTLWRKMRQYDLE